MLLQEGYYDCTTLPSSGGLRRRSSAKLEDRPVDTGLHALQSAVHQPYLRRLRTSNEEDDLMDARADRSVSDPGYLRADEDEDDASPAAAGVLGRIASLSASALGSSLPLLRGIGGSFTRSNDSTSTTDNSCSDTAQQQQQQHDQATYDQLARQDAASTNILLIRDCDAMHAAARRPRCSSSSASSGFACKPREALAGQTLADLGDGGFGSAAAAGYGDDEAPAGSPGVPGARLLATAVGVGRGTLRFKSDRNPKKSD